MLFLPPMLVLQATHVATATSILSSAFVSPGSLFFLWTGGRCKRTCKPSAGNVLRMHDFSCDRALRPTAHAERWTWAQAKKHGKWRCWRFLVKYSSSLSSNDDVGRTLVARIVTVAERPRNLADARYRSGVQWRDQIRTILWPLLFPHEAWHPAMWRNQDNATREHWEPFLHASLGVPSPSPKLDFQLEVTTYARARLLTPAWSSSSGPNGPGAGSLRVTHWVCTRRICFRVSCVIGATHILKGCQSLSHAVTHSVLLLPKTAHSDSQLRYKGCRSASGHGSEQTSWKS